MFAPGASRGETLDAVPPAWLFPLPLHKVLRPATGKVLLAGKRNKPLEK